MNSTVKDKSLQLFEDLKRLLDESINKLGLPIINDEKTGDPILLDQRTVFIKFLLPIKKILPFYEGLKRGEVLGTRCKQCGAKYFPPQADCSKCYSSDIEWIKIKDEGVLLTFTQIKVKPASFSNYDDYIVGVAGLEDGLKIIGIVMTDNVNSLQVGMRVKLLVQKQPITESLIYAFKPL